MISRIEGRLVAVGSGRVQIRAGQVTYEVLVPGRDLQRLATMVGETIEIFTLHYYEGQGQGTSFVPRLLGFASEEDRAFFELFTTVKGMGNRKALRAFALPTGAIARAIADRDLDLLMALPEVGKRTAETIVAELHGKVDRFVELKPAAQDSAAPEIAARRALIRDAMAVLTRLGEGPLVARTLVERALVADPTIESADALLQAAFKLKELPA